MKDQASAEKVHTNSVLLNWGPSRKGRTVTGQDLQIAEG